MRDVEDGEEGISDEIRGAVGGGSGAAAGGESRADEFAAGDGGISAGGVSGGGEASGVAEGSETVVASNTEDERSGGCEVRK